MISDFSKSWTPCSWCSSLYQIVHPHLQSPHCSTSPQSAWPLRPAQHGNQRFGCKFGQWPIVVAVLSTEAIELSALCHSTPSVKIWQLAASRYILYFARLTYFRITQAVIQGWSRVVTFAPNRHQAAKPTLIFDQGQSWGELTPLTCPQARPLHH